MCRAAAKWSLFPENEKKIFKVRWADKILDSKKRIKTKKEKNGNEKDGPDSIYLHLRSHHGGRGHRRRGAASHDTVNVFRGTGGCAAVAAPRLLFFLWDFTNLSQWPEKNPIQSINQSVKTRTIKQSINHSHYRSNRRTINQSTESVPGSLAVNSASQSDITVMIRQAVAVERGWRRGSVLDVVRNGSLTLARRRQLLLLLLSRTLENFLNFRVVHVMAVGIVRHKGVRAIQRYSVCEKEIRRKIRQDNQT